MNEGDNRREEMVKKIMNEPPPSKVGKKREGRPCMHRISTIAEEGFVARSATCDVMQPAMDAVIRLLG